MKNILIALLILFCQTAVAQVKPQKNDNTITISNSKSGRTNYLELKNHLASIGIGIEFSDAEINQFRTFDFAPNPTKDYTISLLFYCQDNKVTMNIYLSNHITKNRPISFQGRFADGLDGNIFEGWGNYFNKFGTISFSQRQF